MKLFKEAQGKIHPGDFKIKPGPHNLAYVIYTSGSTGKPKGVMIEQHSIVNQMQWLQNTFNLNNESVIIQKTQMSFDAAQWEILAPCCGSTVVMGNTGLCKNPAELIESIIEHQVTVLQCVPTLFQALLDTNELHNCRTLTHIFIGGEVLLKHLALEGIKTLPECNFVNLYGPTECTINTSAFVIKPNNINESPTIAIGTPITNLQYYILDEHRKPVDLGEKGELYIGGAGLARGYIFQPELTAEKFIINPFGSEPSKLYRSGDLAYWNPDGSVQCVGRIDNQVKLRGFRIELDEIKSVIEAHDWIKSSAVILKNNPHNGHQNLIAFIEIDPKEAALMDQGNHDSHHESKESKAQVLLQLSNKGCREETEGKKPAVNLPGKTPTSKQMKEVFARKTYRFFEGGEVNQESILRLLLKNTFSKDKISKVEDIQYNDLGEILRYFGQYRSENRLLPKYGYASPGALYATQMYLELDGVCHLKSGYYYYHPVHHQLILIKDKIGSEKAEIKVHFIGKKSAIEPIYKNNIQEVLEIEAGHMVGLFEKILPEYGLNIQDCDYVPSSKNFLDCSEEDFYLGAFQIISNKHQVMPELVDIYVQIHAGKVVDMKAGLYEYKNENMQKISDEIILRKQVIAINQEVYDRCSFGITVISKTNKEWMGYINLGRKLQSLQMNDIHIGLMSSGYSSKSGNDLPSAKRIRNILDKETGPSYFFIGGHISNEQLHSQGMKEDAVHMKGPVEMIKDDLVNLLPDYMIPNKFIVLDKMPLTVNGKINYESLKQYNLESIQREYIAPRTEIERKISELWEAELKTKNISIQDTFFELGGNSLIAVNLMTKINKALHSSLSLQTLFESPTIENLALKIMYEGKKNPSRLVRLQANGVKKPIFCWPGLGGYCMNLRLLAEKMGTDQPFYGVQTYGINKSEIPYATIKEMAAEDIRLIKKIQPTGPYTLCGYSFGSRVAFETAFQLEQAGEIVENLFLIAPGSPTISESGANTPDLPLYSNKTYKTILFSVFMSSITDSALDECLKVSHDEESFIEYILNKNNSLDPELVNRITRIVAKTYGLNFSQDELNARKLNASIVLFKAKGDDNSFIEQGSHSSLSFSTLEIIEADHYSILKDPYVEKLAEEIKAAIKQKRERMEKIAASNDFKYEVKKASNDLKYEEQPETLPNESIPPFILRWIPILKAWLS